MMNTFLLLLNISFYFIYFYLNRRGNKFFSIGSILLIIYICTATASLFLFIDPLSFKMFKNLEIYSFIYLFFIFYLVSKPIMAINFENVNSIIVPNIYLFSIFSIFVISIFVLFALDLRFIIDNFFRYITSDIVNSSQIYDETRQSSFKTTVPFVGAIATAFRDLPVFLLMAYLVYRKRNIFILVGLIFSVAVVLLSNLAFGLRGNFVYLVFEFIFLYSFFKHFYSQKIRRIGLILIYTIIFLAAIPFIAITIGRFTSSYTSLVNPFYASEYYFGQSMLYFNNYGLDANGLRYGDRVVPLFKQILSLESPENMQLRRIKYHEMSIDDSVFSTFVGDFTLDFGPMITLVIFVIIFFILFSLFQSKHYKVIPFYKIFLLYWVWNILTHGIFLFTYADISGNVKIILFLMIIFYFRLNPYGILINKLRN